MYSYLYFIQLFGKICLRKGYGAYIIAVLLVIVTELYVVVPSTTYVFLLYRFIFFEYKYGVIPATLQLITNINQSVVFLFYNLVSFIAFNVFLLAGIAGVRLVKGEVNHFSVSSIIKLNVILLFAFIFHNLLYAYHLPRLQQSTIQRGLLFVFFISVIDLMYSGIIHVGLTYYFLAIVCVMYWFSLQIQPKSC